MECPYLQYYSNLYFDLLFLLVFELNSHSRLGLYSSVVCPNPVL